MRIKKLLFAIVMAALVVDMMGASRAYAAIQQSKIVSANPANFTPQIPLGAGNAVHTFAQVGDTMFAGGSFSQLGGVSRTNIGAFGAADGVMRPFNPNVNGVVWSITPTTDGQLVIAGTFSTVNGVARRGIAKITTSGVLTTAFNANLDNSVTDTQLVNGRLIASGTFTKKIVALNPTTGADTRYIAVPVTGTVASNAGPTEVYRFSVRPQGDRLVGIGNFTSVGGQTRYRAFMLNLDATSATVSAWNYVPLNKMCSASSLPDYMRDVDFSPQGEYFAFVTTGAASINGDVGVSLCDAASRFETAILAPIRPTWINYTGGDTLHSVAITGVTIYVGGHNRWLNNPQGRDSCGPGCVSRPGIGSINPSTGLATTWNPIRTRGIGAKGLYVTPAGLWVGSDTDFGGLLGCESPGGPNLDDCTGKPLEAHAGIGFLPLN